MFKTFVLLAIFVETMIHFLIIVQRNHFLNIFYNNGKVLIFFFFQYKKKV